MSRHRQDCSFCCHFEHLVVFWVTLPASVTWNTLEDDVWSMLSAKAARQQSIYECARLKPCIYGRPDTGRP